MMFSVSMRIVVLVLVVYLCHLEWRFYDFLICLVRIP